VCRGGWWRCSGSIEGKSSIFCESALFRVPLMLHAPTEKLKATEMMVISISDAAKKQILDERNHRVKLLGKAKPRLVYFSEVNSISNDGHITEHHGPTLSLTFFEAEGLREHEWQLLDLGEDCTVLVGPLRGFPAEKNYIDWDEVKKKFTVMTLG
jgi:hypothetical protein